MVSNGTRLMNQLIASDGHRVYTSSGTDCLPHQPLIASLISHVLVNAHPIFGDAAYAAGCINEPLLDETSSLELRCMHLRVLPAAQQPDPSALAHWETFAMEYPEVTEKQLWFVTLREPLIATDCHRVQLSAMNDH